MKPLAALLIAALVSLGAAGCASLYRLPEPPPREAWARHSLSPTQNRDRSAERYAEARTALFSFLDALASERWDDAYSALSNETRILLDDLATDGRGESVLATGDLRRGDAAYEVDVIDLFVISELARVEDDWNDQPEAESYRRKELWAIDRNGDAHRVILIYESDAWRIHKPDIDLTPGAPGRRASST
jgi:hypothetical protein